MIKVSVFYPNPENCQFDFDYYCNKHLPMVSDLLGQACQGITLDQPISPEGGPRAPYVAICHLFFESESAFQSAFGPHDQQIMSDIPNYTNVSPEVLVSTIRINATRSQTGDLRVHEG